MASKVRNPSIHPAIHPQSGYDAKMVAEVQLWLFCNSGSASFIELKASDVITLFQGLSQYNKVSSNPPFKCVLLWAYWEDPPIKILQYPRMVCLLLKKDPQLKWRHLLATLPIQSLPVVPLERHRGSSAWHVNICSLLTWGCFSACSHFLSLLLTRCCRTLQTFQVSTLVVRFVCFVCSSFWVNWNHLFNSKALFKLPVIV